MSSFNYHLLYSSCGCQEGKKIKILLDEYNDFDSYRKKETPFLCIKCRIVNSINFDIAANKETIPLLNSGNLKKQNKD